MRKVFCSNKGITLIETLIAIAIFTIGIIGFAMFFVHIWKANSFIFETGQATSAASRAVNETIKDIRRIRQADTGAYPLKSGNSFDLVAYIDIDNDGITERVHYFLDDANDQLKRGTRKPTGNPLSYPAGDEEVTIVAHYVVNDSSHPIFYYYNENYPGDLANNPVATPLVNVNNIRLIRVRLEINPDPGSAPENAHVESFVELRNINDYI